MRSEPSLHDVAERAGVSHQTVSNVLNRPRCRHLVAPKTALRIRAAASELGYVGNQMARRLREGRTYEIVFATPASLRYAYVHDFVEALLAALAAQHYRLDLELYREIAKVPSLYRTFTKGRCDGVVLYGVYPEYRGALTAL
ncbi:MAG: LacI family DNA-binding transcriptional regulator [Kiritimatiellae bacterium]|nr:LacI family DNA-binding transcriptional regulator [Kiritimatiellia bacterium]